MIYPRHEPCPSRIEGAGKTGCALHPRSRVQLRTENAHTSIQVQRKHSGLPCAVALRLTSCSPVNGSLATVIGRSLASRRFDASTAASGPHGLMSSAFTAEKMWAFQYLAKMKG